MPPNIFRGKLCPQTCQFILGANLEVRPRCSHGVSWHRSKAVVAVFFLFCVVLWFILHVRGASCFNVFPCSLSSCFVVPINTVITSLGEEGAGLCALRAFVCLLSFFSSSWCRGLAVVCDSGTPWTFLLTFLVKFQAGEIVHLCR